MKIKINNFGPIEEFTYDLKKDLIVTYGNNNIGKSYAMQIVYLLLKTFNRQAFLYNHEYYHYHTYFGKSISVNNLMSLVKSFLDSNEYSKDITEYVIKAAFESFSNTYLPEIINSFKNTFGNFDNTLEQKPIIKIKTEQCLLIIDLANNKIEGNLNKNKRIKPIKLSKSQTEYHKSRDGKDSFHIYVVSDISTPTNIVDEQIRKFYTDNISRPLRLNYSHVYFLPASRSGIYSGMNAFGSIIAELSKNRAFVTRKIELPGISEPISDYFIALSSKILAKENEELSEYYSEIEERILKGKITFDQKNNSLLYKPNNLRASFEMTEVSSMVSEISPVVAFLKFILSQKNVPRRRGQKSILFIEEPEAHLHPDNQVALIEIFAKLVKSNVKLIMSSHSNYVFNKLNNLVLGKKLDYHVYQPIVLEDNENGSVSRILPIDELGAEDENFMDTSLRLYDEREEIIEQLYMENEQNDSNDKN
ncbi:MAG: ATP-binding protein [Lachnospiraceae bacterium]|nr:ATP-binding protein [Lachnospiraceae bacterium]